MKRNSILFLQAVVVIVGIGVLAFMLAEPHFEGRNVNATVFQIYFTDPFLAYAYTASIAFFAALYQAFKLLAYIGRNEIFSSKAVTSLRTIRYCAFILIAFLLGAEAYLHIVMRGKDDIAGGVMMGLLMIFISSVVAAAAAVFEKIVRRGRDSNP
jgi:hypothetical protein